MRMIFIGMISYFLISCNDTAEVKDDFYLEPMYLIFDNRENYIDKRVNTSGYIEYNEKNNRNEIYLAPKIAKVGYRRFIEVLNEREKSQKCDKKDIILSAYLRKVGDEYFFELIHSRTFSDKDCFEI